MRLMIGSVLGACLSCALFGCASSSVTLFKTNELKASFAPTDPKTVGVYRSTRPFDSFVEIGLITLKTGDENLESIYQKLRAEAAKHGAEAVIDVKIGSESHTDSEPIQVCNSTAACSINGMCTPAQECHMETQDKTVTTFTTEGSMIRRKP